MNVIHITDNKERRSMFDEAVNQDLNFRKYDSRMFRRCGLRKYDERGPYRFTPSRAPFCIFPNAFHIENRVSVQCFLFIRQFYITPCNTLGSSITSCAMSR